MRNDVPPWERRQNEHDQGPITTYTLHLGGETYEVGKTGVAQALSEAGACITATTEGRR